MEWCADRSDVLKADSHIEAPIRNCKHGKKTDVSKTWLKVDGWGTAGRYKRQWKGQLMGVKINRQRHKTDRQRY